MGQFGLKESDTDTQIYENSKVQVDHLLFN